MSNMTIHCEKDSMLVSIIQATFPNYTGNKVKIEVSTNPVNCSSYWEGGSRDYFSFLDLATMKAIQAPAQSAFDKKVDGLDNVKIEEGKLIVKHTIFMGRDCGITIYIHPNNINNFAIPEKVELTRNEQIVLIATRSLKSSYGGISNFRFHQANKDTGINLMDWEESCKSLINKGLLNGKKAITIQGKNAIGRKEFWTLDK